MAEYIVKVGDVHPALVVVGGSYDRESCPDRERVRSVIDSGKWELSHVRDIRSGPVEIQHEHPPVSPYDAHGVVVVFDQCHTVDEWDWDGPLQEAINLLHVELDDIEVWIDAVRT